MKKESADEIIRRKKVAQVYFLISCLRSTELY